MNTKIILIVILLFNSQLLISQDLEIGSSIGELPNSITSETRFRKIDLGLWLENEIYQYEITSKLHLLVSQNYYPFGVLILNEEPYFLIDIDGDSIFDIKTDKLFVPHWIVSLNSKVKTDRTNIENIFNMYYIAYQNNESILTSESIINATKEIVFAGKDLLYPNRDILYILYLYNNFYISKEYQLCLKYLEILDKTMTSSTNKNTQAILLIYHVETLYKLNEFQKALDINNTLLKLFPEFIPGKVYQVLLEQDPEKRNKLMDELLRKYSEHWLIKEKFMSCF